MPSLAGPHRSTSCLYPAFALATMTLPRNPTEPYCISHQRFKWPSCFVMCCALLPWLARQPHAFPKHCCSMQ